MRPLHLATAAALAALFPFAAPAQNPVAGYLHRGERAKGDESEPGCKPKCRNENGAIFAAIDSRLSGIAVHPAQVDDAAAARRPWGLASRARPRGPARAVPRFSSFQIRPPGSGAPDLLESGPSWPAVAWRSSRQELSATMEEIQAARDFRQGASP